MRGTLFSFNLVTSCMSSCIVILVVLLYGKYLKVEAQDLSTGLPQGLVCLHLPLNCSPGAPQARAACVLAACD